jgi:molecular chaperone HscB
MSKTSAAAAKASTSDHFELFGLPPAFRIDVAGLEAAYRDIQSQVHPDRFAHASDAERRASMQMTTRINEAYRTLKDPVRRASYLLERAGIDLAFETDTSMPKEFLMRQMEMRERLDDARDAAALDAILRELGEEQTSIEGLLGARIDVENDLVGARALVRELMFYKRLGDEVGDAYEELEG